MKMRKVYIHVEVQQFFGLKHIPSPSQLRLSFLGCNLNGQRREWLPQQDPLQQRVLLGATDNYSLRVKELWTATGSTGPRGLSARRAAIASGGQAEVKMLFHCRLLRRCLMLRDVEKTLSPRKNCVVPNFLS